MIHSDDSLNTVYFDQQRRQQQGLDMLIEFEIVFEGGTALFPLAPALPGPHRVQSRSLSNQGGVIRGRCCR